MQARTAPRKTRGPYRTIDGLRSPGVQPFQDIADTFLFVWWFLCSIHGASLLIKDSIMPVLPADHLTEVLHHCVSRKLARLFSVRELGDDQPCRSEFEVQHDIGHDDGKRFSLRGQIFNLAERSGQ